MAKAWFRAKRYGYGAGLPIAWQGWVALIVFISAVVSYEALMRHLIAPGPQRIVVTIAGVLVLIAIFWFIARSRTEGGWRWRNGEDD